MAERRTLQFATGNKIYEARLTADEAALRAMKHFAALQQNTKQNLAVLCFLPVWAKTFGDTPNKPHSSQYSQNSHNSQQCVAPNWKVTFSREFYEARLTADEAALRAMKHFAAVQQNMKQNLAVLCFFARLGKKNGANDRNRQGGRSLTKSFRASGSNRRKVRIAIGGKPIRQSGDINTKMTAKFYFVSHF